MKANVDVKTIPVKIRKLDTILATHEPDLRVVDILAVDVEGWELNVMRGLTLERYSHHQSVHSLLGESNRRPYHYLSLR